MVCHVVSGGSRCVAAASNDTAPALITLGATVEFVGPRGRRTVAIDELYHADGTANTKRQEGEVLVSVRVPAQRPGHRGAYVKLRSRDAIDFPLLGVAARIDLTNGVVDDADVAVVALQARPLKLKGIAELLKGKREGTGELGQALEAAAEKAAKQCRPMPNVPGDHQYRQLMVPVYVRRALVAALASGELENKESGRAND
jgi:4-hydroxybenzoyl-CoA reductase subunit beta